MRRSGGLIEVAVADQPPLWFCVDADADDPVSGQLLEHGRFDAASERLALDLVRRGDRVLDVGCGAGTLSLPAAALGADVAAVDRSEAVLELLWTAARRNGITSLRPVLADEPEDPDALFEWPPLDGLLKDVGWDRVDLLRLAAGGGEASLVAGARQLREQRSLPPIVVAADAAALARHGSSPSELRELLEELGYRLFLVDPARKLLVEVGGGDLQPANVVTYAALAGPVEALAPGWREAPRLDRAEVVRLIAAGGSSDDPAERAHAATLLAGGPAWLRNDEAAVPVRRALQLDVSPRVRSAAARDLSPAARDDPGDEGGPPPAAVALPPGLVLLARGVSLRSPDSGFERPPGASPAEELVVRRLSIDVAAGTYLGVLAGDEAGRTALLSACAGSERPAGGELTVRVRSLLVAAVDRLVEETLSVAENIVVLGVYFGGEAGDLSARASGLAATARIDGSLARPAGELDVAALARLALVVALEHAAGALLLVDRLPELDPVLRRWARGRLRELQLGGTAILQACESPGHLLARPTRMLWIERGEVEAYGHVESVSLAFRNGPGGCGREQTA